MFLQSRQDEVPSSSSELANFSSCPQLSCITVGMLGRRSRGKVHTKKGAESSCLGLPVAQPQPGSALFLQAVLGSQHHTGPGQDQNQNSRKEADAMGLLQTCYEKRCSEALCIPSHSVRRRTHRSPPFGIK